MFTIENQLYVRFFLLLIRGGSAVLRKIVDNGLQEKRISMVDFLCSNKTTIEEQLTPKHIKLLYPDSHDPPDMSKWDISLLSYICLTFFTNQINSSEYKAVSTIRDMRNEFQMDYPDASIDVKTYVSVCKTLSDNCATLCNGFTDTDKSASLANFTMSDVMDEIRMLTPADDLIELIQKQIEQIAKKMGTSHQAESFTVEIQLYVRFVLLLTRGGGAVLRKIVANQLQKNKTTLVKFLSSNKIVIIKKLFKKQIDLLYPKPHNLPDMSKWDISLLSHISSTLFKNEKTVCTAVSDIREMRNTFIAHNQDASIDLQTYVGLYNTLIGIIATVGKGFTDTDTSEINSLVESASNANLTMNAVMDEIKMCTPEDDFIELMQKQIEQIANKMDTFHQDVIDIKDLENKRQMEKSGRSICLFKELKDDLMSFYREQHNTLPLSPLIDADKAPLLQFYVIPDISAVKVQRAFGGGKEIRNPVQSLRDFFFKDSIQFKKIYLSADAGLGKTAFSQRLALTWCQAHNPTKAEEHFFQDDEILLAALKEFDFLFLLFLRQSLDKCELLDLIKNQIDRDLPVRKPAVTAEDIDRLLLKNKCLVILDGLDEWTHPKSCRREDKWEPHKKVVYESCTFLTTSRPWKLDDIDSSSQKFELVRLNEKSKEKLQNSVISHLSNETDDHKLREYVRNFSTAVVKQDIKGIDSVPLLLMYLLCLWWDKTDLGKSLCELYINIVELLLSRTIKKYEKIGLKPPQMPQEETSTQRAIPQRFGEKAYCAQFSTLLKKLAKLAFESLFDETRENTLVFDNKTAEKFLSKELLKFCLDTGIISQSRIREKVTYQEAKVSFAHKTVQEFFAALYMHTASAQTSEEKNVLIKCTSVKDIQEMSTFFIFLSGINVNALSLISNRLTNIINNDEMTLHYRSMTHIFDEDKYIKPLRDLQDMYLSCVKEDPGNTNLTFYQDIIIDEECLQAIYHKRLQHITVKTKVNIKSVRIYTRGISNSIQEIINTFNISDLRSVVKIYFKGQFDNCDMTPLSCRSVEYLTLSSFKWQNYDFKRERSAWSPSLSSSFFTLDNLEGIDLYCFEMSHDQLKELVQYVSAKKSLKEIVLLHLLCTEHVDSCPGFSLDLSLHSRLRKLELLVVPLSELNINVVSLEMCYVGHLSKPGLVSRYLSSLLAASKLHTFRCGELESSKDITTMLTTLPELAQVKTVLLNEVKLRNRQVPLATKMVNVENIYLYNVTMTATVFRSLVDILNQLPQTVSVAIGNEDHKTSFEEFETEKEKIKESQDFYVEPNTFPFQFTTIKTRPRD